MYKPSRRACHQQYSDHSQHLSVSCAFVDQARLLPPSAPGLPASRPRRPTFLTSGSLSAPERPLERPERPSGASDGHCDAICPATRPGPPEPRQRHQGPAGPGWVPVAGGAGPSRKSPPSIKRSVDRRGRFAQRDLEFFFVRFLLWRIILGRSFLIRICHTRVRRKFSRKKSRRKALFFGRSHHPDDAGASSGQEGGEEEEIEGPGISPRSARGTRRQGKRGSEEGRAIRLLHLS